MVSPQVFSRIKQKKKENSDVLVCHVLFWVSPRKRTDREEQHIYCQASSSSLPGQNSWMVVLMLPFVI